MTLPYASAIWQNSDVPFHVAMQQTERTNKRNARTLPRPGEIPQVPSTAGAVDNEEIPVADVMASHLFVGVDREGELCSCGTKSVTHLEHLGAIACEALGARVSEPDFYTAEDVEWEKAQIRAHNLASFQKQPAERAPRKQLPVFSLTQLAIAEQVYANQQAQARTEAA